MLDRNHGQSLGEEGRDAFNESLRQANAVQRCGTRWRRPPGLRSYRAELEIRLRVVDGGYEVEDVRLLDSILSDPDLERCFTEVYTGVAIPLPGTVPGRRARVAFPVVIHFKDAR